MEKTKSRVLEMLETGKTVAWPPTANADRELTDFVQKKW